MSETCKGKTKNGSQCSRPPTPGLNGYCRWHFPPDGGGPKPKPGRNPQGGGGAGEKVKWTLLILNTAKNVWEIVKPYLPDVLSLSGTQLPLFEKLGKTKNAEHRTELLVELLKSLSAAQVLQLVTAIASHVPASKASQDRRLQLIATLLSVLTKPSVQKHTRIKGARVELNG